MCLKTDNRDNDMIISSDAKAQRKRCHIQKGHDYCRRQTDMARRYPDDNPLRHLSSHSVGLIVRLSVQRHHQHEIPARTQTTGVNVALTGSKRTV